MFEYVFENKEAVDRACARDERRERYEVPLMIIVFVLIFALQVWYVLPA